MGGRKKYHGPVGAFCEAVESSLLVADVAVGVEVVVELVLGTKAVVLDDEVVVG